MALFSSNHLPFALDSSVQSTAANMIVPICSTSGGIRNRCRSSPKARSRVILSTLQNGRNRPILTPTTQDIASSSTFGQRELCAQEDSPTKSAQLSKRPATKIKVPSSVITFGVFWRIKSSSRPFCSLSTPEKLTRKTLSIPIGIRPSFLRRRISRKMLRPCALRLSL